MKEVGVSTVAKSLGRNKSGCLWKKGKGTKASNAVKWGMKKTWAQKVEDRNKMKSLKARMAEIKAERDAASRAARQRTKEKQERKKVNEMKSAKYQVIKKLSQTKKWAKSAKRQLTQLPPEIFYEKFK